MNRRYRRSKLLKERRAVRGYDSDGSDRSSAARVTFRPSFHRAHLRRRDHNAGHLKLEHVCLATSGRVREQYRSEDVPRNRNDNVTMSVYK
jgi:hypothetical protein